MQPEIRAASVKGLQMIGAEGSKEKMMMYL